MGMGLMDAIIGAKKIIVPYHPGLETMRLMGIVRRYRNGIYVMILPPQEPAKGERDEAEGSQHAPQPQQRHMEIEAPLAAQELPPVCIFSPS